MESNHNKYTVGKYFRNLKNLRMADPKCKELQTTKILQEYVEFLKKNGCQFPKVDFALFYTKNGLPYPGLKALEDIISNEIIIKIPRKMLLTTKNGFCSEITQVFIENPDFFNNKFSSSWEDHILWAFLLYEFQKGDKSEWYYLISNLPREIDYVFFWSNEELLLLEDKDLIKQAQKGRQDYEKEYAKLQNILSNYPQFFKKETYSAENAIWIYTHLVTRCFGKYLAYVTMVPFAEMLNHECSDVYYDFQYNKDNPNKSKESEYPEPKVLKYNKIPQMILNQLIKPLTKEEIENFDTSDGTYNSEDEDSDNEYQYNFPFIQYQEEQNPDIDFNLKREIKLMKTDIEVWLYNNVDFGDSYSIFYAAAIYDEIDRVLKDFLQTKLTYFQAKTYLQKIIELNKKYKLELFQFEKYVLGKKDQYQTPAQKKIRTQKKKEQESIEVKPDLKQEYFQPKEQWLDDEFDYFVMKCSSKDQFQKDSQVYFCYGRLSNRMALSRYGMALEYNKYDHVHLKVDCIQALNKFQVIKQKLRNYSAVSKLKRFKIKHTSLNMALLIYSRFQFWQLDSFNIEQLFYCADYEKEIQSIDYCIKILQDFFDQQFQTSLEENEKNIENQQFGYHQHFALIYRLERQRIIKKQIQLYNIIKVLLERLNQQNQSFEKSTSQIVEQFEQQDEVIRNRILIKHYLSRVKLNKQ